MEGMLMCVCISVISVIRAEIVKNMYLLQDDEARLF